MDHRKNFVRAMKAVAEMDQILARMDEVFKEYHRLVIAKGKGEIDNDYFAHQVLLLGEKRKVIFKKYAHVAKIVEEIKEEYGGEIRE